MDINNNQQINIFTKGMNTDVSDMLMDNSQYRSARNVRLVTNTDENSGELRVTDGTELLDWDLFPGGTIKAMTSIRDNIIVVSYKNNRNYIYVHTTTGNTGWICAYESKKDELFGEYLSLVTRYENDKLMKLYIADGVNQLMYINLSPYINFTGSAPEPLLGIDSIIITIEEFMTPAKASLIETAGQIPGVKVQYAYRYYKLGGAATQISTMSNVVTLYKSPNEGYAETDKHSSKAVKVVLPKSPEGSIDMMLIFRISYVLVGQLPTVNLVYDDTLISEGDFIDTGVNIESLDTTEFLSTVKLSFKPKVIESKNNYLFAGNITYLQSEIDEAIKDSDVRCVSTGDYENGLLLSYNKQLDSEHILTFDKDYWLMCNSTGQATDPDTFGGSGRYLLWTYNVRPVGIDRENRKYIFNSSTELQQTTEQLCSLRQGEVYRYGAIFYDERGNKSSVKWIADIMSPVLHTTNTNLLHRYQFARGSVLYPTFSTVGRNYTGVQSSFFYMTYQIGIDFKVKSLPEGIVAVEIVRVPRTSSDRITITEGIGGFPYRIYHKRESGSLEYEKTQYICPTGYMTTSLMYADSSQADNDDEWMKSNRAVSDNEYLMFATPEYVYLSDDIKNIIKTDKNNLFLDMKYNMHSNIAVKYTINGEDYGVDSWILNNKPVGLTGSKVQPPYYAYSIGTNGVDLTNGAFFVNAEFIPPFIGDKLNSESLRYTENVWCFILGSADINASVHWNRNFSDAIGLIGESVMNESRDTISAYVGLASHINDYAIDYNKYAIKSIGYPTVPSYDNFVGTDEHKTNWANDVIAVGSDTTYSCWGAPLLLGVAEPVDHMKWEGYPARTGGDYDAMEYNYPVYYPTGSTGKCMVILLDGSMRIPSYSYNTSSSGIGFTANANAKMPTMTYPLIRLRKKGVVPYGGGGNIKNSNYISSGHIIKAGKTVEVFDGDCYPGVFVYHASHAWYEPNMPGGVRQAGVYMIPVESDIDLSATYGDTYNKLEGEQKYYVQDKAAAITQGFVQNLDAYLYNTAYGASPNAMTYSAIKYTDIDTSNCDTRIYYSQPKTNGEHIDNWLNFKAMDFLDVDSRFGCITNMRLFKDAMLFWLNNATGVLSINERTILNDASDNLIILGTGDVLQRYDYISTLYGMLPNQYEAETQSNSTQYFWDGLNKEILSYSGGMELTPLTKVKNVRKYINDSQSVSHPSLSYDNVFNEMIASVVDNGSVVYNEQTLCFTSIYTFNPTYRAVINDRLYYNSGDYIYRVSVSLPQNSTLFGSNANPTIRYVVNSNAQYPKVFDISTFGGRFYGGDDLSNITFDFYTPLKQHSTAHGNQITNREYDFRLDIPRNADSSYGDRMRGKTMQCEISSNSNSTDFSLQYVVTKYRMSWS